MKYFTPTKLSENIHETPEGYLICRDVPIGRTGKMIYGPGETPLPVGKDGKIVISRDADELFSPETIASFEGKSFTINHPKDFVDPDNWKEFTKGILQDVRKSSENDEDLISDILIMDSVAIGLVKKGLREISCGYEALYESTGEGTGRQYKIRGNHAALVEEGRAGTSYAIKDSKYNQEQERSHMQKLSDKIKGIFYKAVDEAMESQKTENKDAFPDKNDKKDDDKKEESKDAKGYDELVKMVKDLGEKVDSMNKSKDADETDKDKKDVSKDADEDKDKKDEGKDADEEAKSSVEERLKALELMIKKLSEGKDEDMDESKDDDDDADEMGDAATKTGDTASRAEILAPGISFTKDVKAKALKAAYATKEGKEVIDQLSGGKLTFDSAEKVSNLFIAASEVLKAKRGTGLANTKSGKATDSSFGEGSVVTAEKMNEMNQAYWSQRK